jgi:hypothetical protein
MLARRYQFRVKTILALLIQAPYSIWLVLRYKNLCLSLQHVAASLHDKTASPTDNRSAAVAYFNSIVCSRDTDPLGLEKMTKESIRRRLGYKAHSKKSLNQHQVDDLVSQFFFEPVYYSRVG